MGFGVLGPGVRVLVRGDVLVSVLHLLLGHLGLLGSLACPLPVLGTRKRLSGWAWPTRGHAHLHDPEVALDDGNRDVAYGHLTDPALDPARVRVTMENEVRRVLDDRGGETVRPQERPDVRALADQRHLVGE
jgi:hypothetical protein